MITNHITHTMANPEIIAELGRRFKEYRLTYRFTQKEAAEKAGVSLITLRQFENGKAYNINMGNFLALMRVVECLEQIDDLMPEIHQLSLMILQMYVWQLTPLSILRPLIMV